MTLHIPRIFQSNTVRKWWTNRVIAAERLKELITEDLQKFCEIF